jgi:hypothetical protein
VEFDDISSRSYYISYPCGATLPIYIISVLRGAEPTHTVLMVYNLANHFLIALILGLTVYVFLLRIGFRAPIAFLLSVIPIALELLLPCPLYQHQHNYFTDQEVIIYFAFLIFLEVARDGTKSKRGLAAINVSQGVVLFLGTMTDWFMIPIALTVFAKRLISGEIERRFRECIRKTIVFWFPVALALGLFILQLTFLDSVPRLIQRFVFRSGLDAPGAAYADRFFAMFWMDHIVRGYGRIAVSLFFGSFAIFLVSVLCSIGLHKRGKGLNPAIPQILYLIGMVSIPCLLQVYILKNHSAIHEKAALKFSVTMAVVPFVMIPVLLCTLFGNAIGTLSLSGLRSGARSRASSVKSLCVIAFICVCLISYLAYIHPRFADLFPEYDSTHRTIGHFIARNTGFRDVVFSPNYEIPRDPAEKLAYSMKRVYKTASLNDIYEKVKNIDEDFTINVLFIADDAAMSRDIEALKASTCDIRRESDLSLYKISRQDFYGLDSIPHGRKD